MSRVQEFALSLLLYQEETEALKSKAAESRTRAETRLDLIKSALLSTGRTKLVDLFPEFVPKTTTADEIMDAWDRDVPHQTVSDIESDEAYKIAQRLDQLLSDDSGTLRLDDIHPPTEESYDWNG